MSDQVKAALLRAVLLLLAGALTGAGSALGTGGNTQAVIAGALAGAGAARAGEGFYDSWRQSTGNVKPGDVTPPPH